jgi:hypothetical protein
VDTGLASGARSRNTKTVPPLPWSRASADNGSCERWKSSGRLTAVADVVRASPPECWKLRAPALLPERLALDSLEGASLDLALALASQRGCGLGLDGGGLRCRGLRCRLGYRPLLQSDDFRFGHTL